MGDGAQRFSESKYLTDWITKKKNYITRHFFVSLGNRSLPNANNLQIPVLWLWSEVSKEQHIRKNWTSTLHSVFLWSRTLFKGLYLPRYKYFCFPLETVIQPLWPFTISWIWSEAWGDFKSFRWLSFWSAIWWWHLMYYWKTSLQRSLVIDAGSPS